MTYETPLFNPKFTEADMAAVASVVKSGWVSPHSLRTEFEHQVADMHGAKYATAVNSGTAALMLAMKACDIPSMTVPAYGMCAAANVATMMDMSIYLHDVDAKDGCIVRASDVAPTVVIHHNGCTDYLKAVVKEHRPNNKAYLIEDAAQAFGNFHKITGDFCCLSFSAQKPINTGQGGMVLTNQAWAHEAIQRLVDHGGGDWRKDRVHRAAGGNFRMSDLNAGLGLSMLKRWKEIDAERLRVRELYSKWLDRDIPGWQWTVCIRSNIPEPLIVALSHYNIEAAQLYQPTHFNAYCRMPAGMFPAAEEYARHAVYLPSWNGLEEEKIKLICAIVKDSE